MQFHPPKSASFRPLPGYGPVVIERPDSKAKLAELLEAHGIRASLAQQAKWGLALVADDAANSCLGGCPPIDGEWPRSSDGRAHTHLASIALSEVPDFEDRDLLPPSGTLVFFAFVGDAGDDEAHVIHVPSEAGPAIAPTEESLEERVLPTVLEERRVRLEPVLTLPFPDDLEDHEEAALLDLDELGPPDHLLLGHPVYVQDNPPEDGRISLLQMNWDEPLGFMFGDGGQITLHGTADDIRAGRWDRITAQTDDS